MKLVMIKNCPKAVLVDITHQVERHNIVEGAFLLEMAVPFFPDGTVHVAVVDPGVGSDRAPVVVECKGGHVLVGPDNGLLTRAAGLLGKRQVFRIEKPGFLGRKVSPTFHGRDLFAMAAAKIACGARPSEAGGKMHGLAELPLRPLSVTAGRVECSVVHIDVFGNVILDAKMVDLSRAGLQKSKKIRLIMDQGGSAALRFVKAYYEVGKGELMILEGSQGYVEIAARETSASEKLRVKLHDRIQIIG
jgi:S-adenosyl-L-methionine hydrolase (adenosine-forming)